MRVTAEWLLRIMLFLAFLTHGLGKFTSTGAFTEKFDFVSTWQALALGTGELAAAVGMIAGGLLIRPGAEKAAGFAVTAAAILAVVTTQVLAIAFVAWPAWLFFAGGFEYNLALILMALSTALLAYQRWRGPPDVERT